MTSRVLIFKVGASIAIGVYVVQAGLQLIGTGDPALAAIGAGLCIAGGAVILIDLFTGLTVVSEARREEAAAELARELLDRADRILDRIGQYAWPWPPAPLPPEGEPCEEREGESE